MTMGESDCRYVITRDKYDAVLLDLDGVVTDTDYRVYIDGKPRFDGVRDFLASRKIRLPEGNSEDSPQTESVCGLGNRKNKLVNKMIQEGGVEAYDGSIRLIHQLHRDQF